MVLRGGAESSWIISSESIARPPGCWKLDIGLLHRLGTISALRSDEGGHTAAAVARHGAFGAVGGRQRHRAERARARAWWILASSRSLFRRAAQLRGAWCEKPYAQIWRLAHERDVAG